MNESTKAAIQIIGVLLVIGLFVMFLGPWNEGGKYRAFKCNYRAAIFGPDASENIKEFGGDPCMKKGNNRFKSYYPNKFEDLTMCEIFRDTTDQSYLKAPSDTYVVDCEKI